LESRRAQHQ